MSWSIENDNCSHLKTKRNRSQTRNRTNGCGESNNKMKCVSSNLFLSLAENIVKIFENRIALGLQKVNKLQ